MALQLKLKKSSVSGKVPQQSDLEYGELAINYADGKLYYKRSDNVIDSFISGSNYVISVAGLNNVVTKQQLLEALDLSTINADYLSGYGLNNFILKDQLFVNFAGTIAHTGLVFTEGTSIDQAIVFTKPLNLTGQWQDVGISGGDLSNGTYMIQMYANDSSSGGSNINEYYSGIMSWYNGLTTTTQELPTDEIALHRAGASEDGGLYLRTYRVSGQTLKLQVYSNIANASEANYVFKFRRMI